MNEKDEALTDQAKWLIKREVQRILGDEDGVYLSVSAFNQYQSAIDGRLTNIDKSVANLNEKLEPVLKAQEKVLLTIGQGENEKIIRAAEKSVKDEAREEARARREWWSWFVGITVGITVLIGVVLSVLKYINAHP